MFPKERLIRLDGAIRKNILENTLFIQGVCEGDRRDKILEDVFMRSSEENHYHKRVQAHVRLCNAIMEEKQQRFADERAELLKRMNVQSLKKLETNIRAGYTSKTIAAQTFEREALKDEEKARICYQNNGLEQARLREDEYAKKIDEERQQKKAALKKDLLAQMAITKAKREEEKINLIQEKQMMDDAVKKYKEDMLQNSRDEHEKKIRTKTEMEEFIRIQNKFRLDNKMADNDEIERADDMIRQRELAAKKAIQDKLNLQNHKNKISEDIGSHTHEITQKKLKSFQVLTELLIDERKAKEEMKHLKSQERDRLQRITIRQNLDRLVEEKQRQQQAQKKQDEAFRQLTLLHLEEQHKLKLLADEKKKIKALEHRRALQSSLDEIKRARAKDMKGLLIANTIKEKNYLDGERLVGLARTIMLKKHAPALKGILPPRVLNSLHGE